MCVVRTVLAGLATNWRTLAVGSLNSLPRGGASRVPRSTRLKLAIDLCNGKQNNFITTCLNEGPSLIFSCESQ